MLVLEFRFPAGRYHATPWGRHVNEGALDWPPSPWRLIRALVATWHLKAKADLSEGTVRSLIEALASCLPSYELPRASPGHTRHYMPVIEGKTQKTTKVFDTFLHLAGPLRIGWAVSLDAEQRRALNLLCSRIGYFGRAESLVEATVLPDGNGFSPNAQPLPDNQPVPKESELIRVLCPLSAAEFAQWLAGRVNHKKQELPGEKGRSRKVAKSFAMPEDLFDALHLETVDLQANGWTLPPGSRWVDYIRPANCMRVTPVRSHYRTTRRPVLARFAISSAVLPRILKAVSVAERIHQGLLARFPNGEPPAIFSGRDPAGTPLTGHNHLYIYCEANGVRDTITHVTLFAREGFDLVARHAIESLTRVWGHGGHDLQLILLGFGDERTFADCRLFGPSPVWRSLTPFVATRHPKTYRDGRPKLDADGWWIGSPEHDLRRLIRASGLPLPIKIERLETIPVGPLRLRPLVFQTLRHHGQGRRAGVSPAAFQITFSTPVAGPLAFGYAAHFGLGLFIPCA
ncbi:MAG: type I-U CRISPR-associated protein Csb2 [Verrucomicrobiota bacterium]|nr:type I-U CRISPR-associated protein Csb2 [Limisphaera sp.]MDW8382881.1 type I-U CRISPR-associated protein Csb2 [Verrucomicrobiota bacterium]